MGAVASACVDTFPWWFFDIPLVSRGRGVQAPAIAEYVKALLEYRLFTHLTTTLRFG
ncbi:hypothetical protein [Bosea sp. AS-1]|uniref:hypothetical protein n=1 Tax=Bosea sp. AS-1 TaxID=2015316 RepID=UPI0012FD8080|nr:hypothetical protein [Bosea sp. AS-1]